MVYKRDKSYKKAHSFQIKWWKAKLTFIILRKTKEPQILVKETKEKVELSIININTINNVKQHSVEVPTNSSQKHKKHKKMTRNSNNLNTFGKHKLLEKNSMFG